MCSKLRYHVGVGRNSKERKEVLDLCKHISAGLMEKEDRLMLLEKIIMVHEKGHIILWP